MQFQVAVRIEKKWGGEKKRVGVCFKETTCVWEGGGAKTKETEKSERRTWCTHLLITICRIVTQTSYSVRWDESRSRWRCCHVWMWHLTGCAAVPCMCQRDVTLVTTSGLTSQHTEKLGHQPQRGADSPLTLHFFVQHLSVRLFRCWSQIPADGKHPLLASQIDKLWINQWRSLQRDSFLRFPPVLS